MPNTELSAAGAQALDARDPLASFAADFHHPRDPAGRPLVYLGGHSLGLQPKSTFGYIEEDLADWRDQGALAHHTAKRPWIAYHELLAQPLAALAGANPAEVVAMNALTVNLHLMMVSFFRPAAARDCIMIERSAFPSDRYAVLSQLRFHGLDAETHLIEVAPRAGESCLRTEDLIGCIERAGPRLALALLPGVQYLTGQALELAPVIAAARRAGAAVGLDLAHAIGNVALALHDWNADFAVWCSYKYLNAGPGAIGGAFVHARHGEERNLPRFAGWWGQDKHLRFAMGPQFTAIAGAEGWQVSNPPVLAAAPLLASLQIFERAGMPRLRAKSIGLTAYLQRLIENLAADAVEILTPSETEARGCQLSLRLRRTAPSPRRVFDALTAAGVIGDWREPDVLRLAPVPLYNSYSDVFKAAAALAFALRP